MLKLIKFEVIVQKDELQKIIHHFLWAVIPFIKSWEFDEIWRGYSQQMSEAVNSFTYKNIFLWTSIPFIQDSWTWVKYGVKFESVV